jgi:hypothetical protein
MTECYCGTVEGNKVLVCHIHYKNLMEDSNLQFNKSSDDVKIEYIHNIPIIMSKK